MRINCFENMLGQVMESVTTDGDMVFKSDSGKVFRFYHEQDCCEHVYIEDVAGDVQDLVGSPILVAEEISSPDDFQMYEPDDSWDESYQWTFYKFATNKGYVTVRWCGSSNGFYSTSVSYIEK